MAAPKRFVKQNGVNVLNPLYLAWKKDSRTKSSTPATIRQDPIDKMFVLVQVIKAKDLVAKDRNIFGKKTSSDPYVLVSLSCTPSNVTLGQNKRVQKIQLGRTETKKKNLSPTWNHSLKSAIPYSRRNETLHLVFDIFDEDVIGSDDSMGVVKLPALEWKDLNGPAVWYEIPKGSAKSVSGSIQIKITTEVHRVQGLKPYI